MRSKTLFVLFLVAVLVFSVTGCKKANASGSGEVIRVLGPIAQDEDIEKLF